MFSGQGWGCTGCADPSSGHICGAASGSLRPVLGSGPIPPSLPTPEHPPSPPTTDRTPIYYVPTPYCCNNHHAKPDRPERSGSQPLLFGRVDAGSPVLTGEHCPVRWQGRWASRWANWTGTAGSGPPPRPETLPEPRSCWAGAGSTSRTGLGIRRCTTPHATTSSRW